MHQGTLLEAQERALLLVLKQTPYLDLLRAVVAHPEDKPFIIQLSLDSEAQNLRRKLYSFLRDVRGAAALGQERLEDEGLHDLKTLAAATPTLELQVRGDELAILRSNVTPEALAIREAIEANAAVMADPDMTLTKMRQRLREIRGRKGQT